MWASDIVDYLAAEGIGTVGTDLFWGVLPDEPGSCGAVIPYPGAPVEKQFGSEGVWREKARAQFSWRAEKPDQVAVAFTKAQAALDALAAIEAQTIGSTKVYSIQGLQSPGLLYQDEGGLAVVGFNFVVDFEQ